LPFIGIDLERDNMVYNEGKRTISKLMLNSLWGKLAQRPNQGITKICTDYNDYMKLWSDAKYVITGML